MLIAGDEMKVVSVVIAAGIAVVIVRMSMTHRRQMRLSELHAQAADNEARLKGLMLQRGMSADEIERVLKSGNISPLEIAKAGDPESASSPEERIISRLASNGYGGKDIERVLRAARQDGGISPETVASVHSMASQWVSGADMERVLKARHGKDAPA